MAKIRNLLVNLCSLRYGASPDDSNKKCHKLCEFIDSQGQNVNQALKPCQFFNYNNGLLHEKYWPNDVQVLESKFLRCEHLIGETEFGFIITKSRLNRDVRMMSQNEQGVTQVERRRKSN